MDKMKEAIPIDFPSFYGEVGKHSPYRKAIDDFLEKKFMLGKIVCSCMGEAQIRANALRRYCKSEDHVKITSRKNIIYLMKE